MQIQLEKTLDVEVVEGQLAELWKELAGGKQIAGGGPSGDEGTADHDVPVLRARVANLLVFLANAELLDEVHQMMLELTTIHPSRVLLMLGAREAPDRDIEMFVESFCQTDKRTGAKRLCCEEIILKAQGSFVAELPSAALPLLVSDLSTFLWWRDVAQTGDKVFRSLLGAADRLVIDSAEFENTQRDLGQINKLFAGGHSSHVGFSDLNWARLTFWRGLLADFYDVPAYQSLLDNIDHVRIDYVGPARDPETVAPQALLIAGWLASRLGWELADEQPPQEKDETTSFKFSRSERGSSPTTGSRAGQPGRGGSVREGAAQPAIRGSSPTVREGSAGRAITLELNRVEQGQRKPGRLVQVELLASGKRTASFTVTRSADNLHLLTEAKLGSDIQRGRVLPVRNRSAAQLLSREMEILCHDQIYQEAIAMAAGMIAAE